MSLTISFGKICSVQLINTFVITSISVKCNYVEKKLRQKQKDLKKHLTKKVTNFSLNLLYRWLK